ncbi:glycoside hydrolase family 32 protein [Flavobacterium sp. LB2P6]|uniref:glycoside hydrolase family 32 protein n=1 Tax=Flavobacterium sp. LB2P6 TaxID=3401714 RepID=UPI003AB10843
MKFANNILSIFFLFGSTLFLFSCKKEETNTIFAINSSEKIKIDSTETYKEPFRPQFHFSPEKKWMNDPNGMVFYKGIYHLFYQYYPDDIVWGPMHWGHATSTDLIHWTHKKIALFPDTLGMIFSGSAVVDLNNTSGLGTTENPPMVAIFTYHDMAGEKAGRSDYQTQGLAYSLDEGETWLKYEKNPIVKNSGLKDFRDPKVFWNSETNLWNMVLVAGDHAQFYTSENLINWKFESEFGKKIGAHGGVWECPDIFKLKVAGSKEEKWVLLISINPGAPNGGSGTQYFVGDFDGKSFKTTQKDIKWIDNGTDNYAGVTYNNTPDNKRLFLGWMSNWLYARNTPTKNWRSAMTLPRELSLVKINNSYVLKNSPVEPFKKQLVSEFSKDLLRIKPQQKINFTYDNFNQSEIKFKAASKNLKMIFSNEVNDSLVLNYDAAQKTFSIDRRHSGIVNFEQNFGKEIHKTATPNVISETIDYQIILDWSSIEIFLNEGVYSFTEQIFPNKPYTKLSIQSNEKQEIKNLTVHRIKGIW